MDVAGAPEKGYVLRSTSTSVKFPGYLAVYPPMRPSGIFFCGTRESLQVPSINVGIVFE